MADVLVPMDLMVKYLAQANGSTVTVAPDAPLLSMLVQQATILFERQCNREKLAFRDAQAARIEVQSGRGSTHLWLDYPVGAGTTPITAIRLGRSFVSPDETLDPNDPLVIHFEPGSRELLRVDGGLWAATTNLLSWARGGPLRADFQAPDDFAPSFVQVTYDTARDLPEDAQLAIMRRVSTVLRAIGTEEVASERLGDYSYVVQRANRWTGSGDEIWSMAVENHRREVYA